jgi:hypothetical protein
MATKKLIPEPSPRLVIWLVAVTAAMLCGILVGYAIGDLRMAWAGHTTSEPLDFKKSGKKSLPAITPLRDKQVTGAA